MIDTLQLGQETKLEEALVGTIAQGRWRVGERLPAERPLAAEFNVSRNTLRSVLKRLEAKGIVSIRRSSGCYLKSIEPPPATVTQVEDGSLAAVMARFEAAYLFLPELVALAAERIDAATLRTLEISIAELGTAIVERDMNSIKEKTREFFCVIARSTKNQVIVEVIQSFVASSSLMFPRFFSFSEEERDRMFGDFVYVFRGLKANDPEKSRRAIVRKIFNTANAFSKLTNIPLSPVIKDGARRLGDRGGLS
jgi:DNA-binding FadR family transcriptional regulator